MWHSKIYVEELEKFIAISKNGRIGVSENGRKWTILFTPVDNCKSVCWCPHLMLLCAVSDTGPGCRVMTSFDGINWISQNASENNDWNLVYWDSDAFLFYVVNKYKDRVMISIEGINWYNISPDEPGWPSNIIPPCPVISMG